MWSYRGVIRFKNRKEERLRSVCWVELRDVSIVQNRAGDDSRILVASVFKLLDPLYIHVWI